jgi:hypothetical protein
LTQSVRLELSNGIKGGERKVIYPLLFQILEKFEDFKTRVYLYKYLADIKVPSDFFQFDDVAEIHAHYKQLVSDFKNAHQITTDLRAKVASPEQLRNDIMTQEKEREQLLIKIDDLKKKIKDMTVRN